MKFDKLRGRMTELRVTQKQLANAIGIDPSTLNLKITGKRDFTLNEVWMISQVLKLDSVESYFFTK